MLVKNGDFDESEQVSRLLQMPAGVSEHCSVVNYESNNRLLVVYLLTFYQKVRKYTTVYCVTKEKYP